VEVVAFSSSWFPSPPISLSLEVNPSCILFFPTFYAQSGPASAANLAPPQECRQCGARAGANAHRGPALTFTTRAPKPQPMSFSDPPGAPKPAPGPGPPPAMRNLSQAQRPILFSPRIAPDPGPSRRLGRASQIPGPAGTSMPLMVATQCRRSNCRPLAAPRAQGNRIAARGYR